MIHINERMIGDGEPVYFIADIAANHDGNLGRAKDLISLAKEAGADAAKFQHFRAPKIVSDYGFRHLSGRLAHQAKWKKPVFEIYKDASLDWEWTVELSEHCKKMEIDFFSSPYDKEVVDHLFPYVPAYKIGSGDINYSELLSYIASKGKPVILATGASTMEDVTNAVEVVQAKGADLALLQCNTNYTASNDNLKFISLNVLRTYAFMFPNITLGLSDHTPGNTTVLGAVALGARMIEKHFTDDNSREGPDHPFSMNPRTWAEMVDRTRDLQEALGTGIKKIADNERETMIVQRRCLRAAKTLKSGHILSASNLEALRPAPPDGIRPDDIGLVIGKRLRKDLEYGEHVTVWSVEP